MASGGGPEARKKVGSKRNIRNGTRRVVYNGKGSPVSKAGKVYEWDRGVIGISKDGRAIRENLDETTTHHASATYLVATKFDIQFPRTIQPFKAGINCANQGLLLMQFEGDNAYLYFPLSITNEQLKVLNDILMPRQSFVYAISHGENIIDDQKYEDVIQYAESITQRVK